MNNPPWLAFETSPSTSTGLGTTLVWRSWTRTSPETGRASSSHWRTLGEGRSSSEARGTCWPWRRRYGCGCPREGASDGDSEIKVYAIKVVTVTKGLIVSLHHQPQHVGPAHSGSSSTSLKIDQRHRMPSVLQEGCCCQRSQKSLLSPSKWYPSACSCLNIHRFSAEQIEAE